MPSSCPVPAAQSKPVDRSATLGAIVRSHYNNLGELGIYDDWRRRVFRQIGCCGTGLMGWLHLRCRSCNHFETMGRRCQNRHCPACGKSATFEWVEARKKELLDVPYFHLVFTVPSELYPLIEENQSVTYNAMMSSVRDTIMKFCRDSTRMGGTPAAMGVLHTSNRSLGYHPHVHGTVAGVGWNEKTQTLAHLKSPGFLAPIRAMAKHFATDLLARLGALRSKGQLKFEWATTEALGDDEGYAALVAKVAGMKWNAHVERTKGDPSMVMKYLGAYTQQTAISDHRIESHRDGVVTYRWTDNKTKKTCRRSVPSAEFVRMFSRHILPRGFHRIRRWGLLWAQKCKDVLPKVQKALGMERMMESISASLKQEGPTDCGPKCSKCQSSKVVWYNLAQRVNLPLRIPSQLPRPPDLNQLSGFRR